MVIYIIFSFHQSDIKSQKVSRNKNAENYVNLATLTNTVALLTPLRYIENNLSWTRGKQICLREIYSRSLEQLPKNPSHVFFLVKKKKNIAC